MAREYFCAYHSLLESLKPYGDGEVGRLFRSCLLYSMTGKEPDLRGNERYIWPTLKQMIDRDRKAYENTCATNRENGTKGGRPPKNRPVFSETEKTQEEEKEEDKEKDKDEEKEKTPAVAGVRESARPRFAPPTEEEVAAYVSEKGLDMDPAAFCDFYASKGWKVGREPMKDWKAAARNWARKDHELGIKTSAKPPRPRGGSPAKSDANTMSQLRRLREKMTSPQDDSETIRQMDRLLEKMEGSK